MLTLGMANAISRLPEEVVEEFGPAMSALTEPQRSFVLHYCDSGGINAAEAARRAGYGNDTKSQAVTASRMLRLPRILAALREVADHRLKAGAIMAASAIVEIAGDAMHRDRFKAATELLNRAGLVVEGVSRVIVEDHRTPEEIERRIRDLAERLGIDANKMLGQSMVIEGDATDLDCVVENIHREGDEWQAGQREFDANVGAE